MNILSKIIMMAAIPLLLAASSFNTSAQTLTGKVLDENDLPLAFANVIIQTAESTYLDGTITDTLGVFTIERHPDAVSIQISFIGYETYHSPITDNDLGTVILVPDSEMIGKSVVRATLPKTTIQGDAFVTKIENSVLAQAGSANDVLKRLPGIIQKDGGYEVFGKGTPVIYINGRLVRDGSELENLNSTDIQSVDVVQNPGARYDATVKAVIRIKTIKRTGDGFSFDLRSSIWQNELTDLNESLNMNYRHNGLDVFASLFYTQNGAIQRTDLQQALKSARLVETKQSATFTQQLKDITPVVGMNWQISNNHSVGVRYRPYIGLSSSGEQDSDAEATIDGILDDKTNTISINHSNPAPKHQVNMYYNGTVGKLNIDFNADLHDGRSNSSSVYNEKSELQEDRTLNTVSNVHDKLYASKLILTYPVFRGSLVAGSEYVHTDRDDIYTNEEGYVPSAFTTMKENEISAFAEYSFPFKFGSLTAGVRYEHIGFDYFENDVLKEDQSRTYDNFYPNASFNARLGQFMLLLSYSTKTTRPQYSYLSNSLIYIDRYSIQQGNPLLRPEISNDVSLTGVWKFMQASISYKVEKNAILHRGTVQEGNDNAALIYFDNFDKNIPTLTAMVAASPTFGPWNPRLATGLQKHWLSFTSMSETVTLDKPIYIISFGNTLTLPKGFTINVDYNYQSKGDYRVYSILKDQNRVNISVRKSFFKDALSVEIFGNDIFNGTTTVMRMYSDTYTLGQTSWQDNRNFGLTLRYRFNSAQSKYKGTGAGEAQKNRM